jgi:hypothetical protein
LNENFCKCDDFNFLSIIVIFLNQLVFVLFIIKEKFNEVLRIDLLVALFMNNKFNILLEYY